MPFFLDRSLNSLEKKQTLKECKQESLQEDVTTRFKSSQSDMPLYKIQEAPIQRLRRSYESTLRKKAQIGEAGEALELESISPKRERFSFMSAHIYIYIYIYLCAIITGLARPSEQVLTTLQLLEQPSRRVAE